MAGQAWLGVGLAIGGALLLSGVDVTVSGRALVGRRAGPGGRRAGRVVPGGGGRGAADGVDHRLHRRLLPGGGGGAARRCAWCRARRLGGYAGSTWLRLAALALLAQILGHSVFNLVLKTVSPTIVSVALLFEIVGRGGAGRGLPGPGAPRRRHPRRRRHRPRHVPRHPLERDGPRGQRHASGGLSPAPTGFDPPNRGGSGPGSRFHHASSAREPGATVMLDRAAVGLVDELHASWRAVEIGTRTTSVQVKRPHSHPVMATMAVSRRAS